MDKDSKKFYLFNTHLSYSKSCRDETIPELITHIKDIENQAMNSPIFLVGDLNASADLNSRAYDESMVNLLTSAGLNDLWQENNDININPGYTFPWQDPDIRVDYAWANQYFMDNHKSTIEPFANNANGSYHASDHLGLIFSILAPIENQVKTENSA